MWNLHTFCTRAYHKNIFFGEYLPSKSDKFNGYRFYTTLLLGLRKKITRHHENCDHLRERPFYQNETGMKGVLNDLALTLTFDLKFCIWLRTLIQGSCTPNIIPKYSLLVHSEQKLVVK